MRNRSDRYQAQPISALASTKKRLGSYLVEAGLLTSAQLDVALNDQKLTEETTGTHMQLGEIIAARGWLKEQTIEYLMQKIIIPERRALEQQDTVKQTQEAVKHQHSISTVADQPNPPAANAAAISASTNSDASSPNGQAFARRDVPISKPLPSVPSKDEDVSWVG